MAVINGTSGADNLNGTADDDTFYGGAGADLMVGGLGHDVYYVDDVNDIIEEESGEGTDTVYSSINYTLPDNVENLTLTGTAVEAIGNGWDNTLIGNAQNNTLYGGGGADLMKGGAGDDIYYISIFSANGINNQIGSTDVIIESKGHDTVRCFGFGDGSQSFYYIMQKDIEDLDFSMAQDVHFSVVGNKSVNIIRTTNLDDTLDGGKGADTLDGGDGKNTYIVDNAHDVVIDSYSDFDVDGNPDADTADTAQISTSYIMSAGMHVEYVEVIGTKGVNITGNADDNHITGNLKKNTLRGEGGDDYLDGGGGKDNLYGGAGADTFAFSKIDSNVTIRDFNLAEGDKIDIADVLTNYNSGNAISNYIHIEDKGHDSVIYVANASGNFVKVGTILNVNGLTGEDQLLTDGVLIAEHLA